MELQQSPQTKPNQYDVLQEQQPQCIVTDPLSVEQKILTPRYKSFSQMLKIIMNIALSSFYFGYALAYLSAVDFSTIVNIYGIQMKEQVAEGLLIGCMPIGGGVGALASGLLISKYSRKSCLLIVNFIAFVTGILIFLPYFQTFLFCRISQGICAGLYSSLVPLIMNQLSPRQISGTLTSCNQIFIAFGVFFAFAFSYILETFMNDPESQKSWWIIFGFGLIIIMIQTIFLQTIYNFQTPRFLYQKTRDQEGRKLLQIIYKQEYVDYVVKQILQDVGRGKIRSSGQIQIQSTNENRSAVITPRTAIIIAIHLSALQQFSGINAVLAYSGQIVGQDVPSLKLTLPILINLEQVIASIFASYLLTKLGRKTLLQFGCIGSCLSCLFIGIGFWTKADHHGFGLTMIIIGLALFMANFGLTLGPVVWVYLPEIIQSSILPYAIATNWGTASLIMLLFPMIKQKLPEKNPALLFIFFAIWCAVSFCFNKKYLIETQNKTQKQISNEYRNVSIDC